jgi:hypothetical protein
MLHGGIERNVILAAAALVALGTAGCDGTVSGRPAEPAVPTFTSSGPAAPPAPGTTQPPTSSLVPPPPRSVAPKPVEPVAPVSTDCKAADLELGLGRGDAAAGTVYRPLRFTNVGGRTCTIQGFPGVSYVAGEDGHQVGPAARRIGAKGPKITLAPGGSAFATVGFTQVRNFDPGECRPTDVRGLRVYPPHDTAAMFLPMPGTGCASAPPGNQLVVKTVQKGSGD